MSNFSSQVLHTIRLGAFRIFQALAIPFVLLVVAVNLIHPMIHSLEGGTLDLMLPQLDVLALACGGSRVIEWAKGLTSRHHHHHDSCPHS